MEQRPTDPQAPRVPRESRQRVARIPLTYYRRQDWMLRWKGSLALVLGLAAASWAMWGLARDVRQHSPGPLASVHAAWDADCAACHQPFEPMRADAVSFTSTASLAHAKKCEQCHPGPAHHSALKPTDAGTCTECHRDHRGRAASLNEVADHTCVRCHRELPAHSIRPDAIVATGPLAFARVERFGLETHPEFRSTAHDPGKLKFSHRRHLVPGQRFDAEVSLPPKLLSQLSAADREIYRQPGQSEQDAIQLNCASCHLLDQPRPRSSTTAANERLVERTSERHDGAYMLPIRYDAHCQACHPLSFYANAKAQGAPQIVAHGLEPAALAEALEGRVLQAFVAAKPEYAAQQQLSLPGKAPRPDTSTLNQWVQENLPRAAGTLRDKCAQCHELNGPPTEVPVVRTNVPAVWFQSAKFAHSAHRAITCKACHPAAYEYETWQPTNKESALDHTAMMIPALKTCVECHAPRQTDGRGGARFDCVECHRYHGVDFPNAGVGSWLHQLPAGKRLDTHRFLRGNVGD